MHAPRHYLHIPSESGFTMFDAIGNVEMKETAEIKKSAKNRRYLVVVVVVYRNRRLTRFLAFSFGERP
jgi:hypothetical protein